MTRVWAVSMVRDELDVIEGTLRHLAGEGVDGILVADNGSTDGTLDVLYDLERDEIGCPLEILEDPEPGYYQSAKMTSLAGMAADDHGAEWIVPFDADELWLVRGVSPRLGDWLRDLPPSVHVARAQVWNHLRTADDFAGEIERDPFRSMVWRQAEPLGLGKVAVRWNPALVIGAGNHAAQGAHGRVRDGLEVRHFPVRSAEQFTRKAINGAAAYEAAPDLPESIGTHWRDYGRLAEAGGPEALGRVFVEHWFYPDPVGAGLVRDPAPYRRWET